jgi:hypothetical protein
MTTSSASHLSNVWFSVTPLQVDLTRHSSLDEVRDWVAAMPQ